MNSPSDVMREFRVSKGDIGHTEVAEGPMLETGLLAPGQVLVAIDRFALTANNITYAAFGERMKYWDFYPASEGWGIIPVWGFASVVASAANGIAPGARFYGFYPMASHAVLQVARASANGFLEGTPRRQPLAAVYNQYVKADAGASPAVENEQALLKPLYSTAWLIADWLADNGYFGAGTVILSSASSKTAYGTAHAVRTHDGERPRIVGLTSARNRAFTESLGCYDEVRTYDDVGSLPGESKAVYVDMSGDAPLRAAIHARFGDQLAYSCSVGGTHWENLGGGGALPGPKPVLFFAPAQIKKRVTDWGAGELQARMAKGWDGFLPLVRGSMQVIESRGPAAISQVYQAVLHGKAGPREGHILAF